MIYYSLRADLQCGQETLQQNVWQSFACNDTPVTLRLTAAVAAVRDHYLLDVVVGPQFDSPPRPCLPRRVRAAVVAEVRGDVAVDGVGRHASSPDE